MASYTFTIYLLKAIQSSADAIDQEKRTTEHPVTGFDGVTGSLFLGNQNRGSPDWVSMVRPFVTPSLPEIYSASRPAVLIVNFRGKHFAFIFGHGKSLLKPTAWERSFGLRTTLNRVDPDGLRSVDSKTYDHLVVSTRRQTSRMSSINNFELDVGRALVSLDQTR
ncbi:MAG: hypothetical protein EOP84_10885 [Verrucomicrobiaceae bacterium]|nr:MAG: hypothetical protein EOP84_10885 [Verrucomicrobiaceae bacterium]